MRGASSTLVAGCIAFGAPAIAGSAAAAETVRLAWSRGEGADTCVDEAELAARVRARLAVDPFDDKAARIVEGHAVPTVSGFRADLLVRARDGAVLGRRAIETTGEDCTALGQAVTLAVVLTIDPNAPLQGDESTAAFPIDTPSPPQTLPSPAAPPPVATPTPVAAAPRPACEPPTAGVGVSVGPVMTLGLLPRAALGAEIEAAYPALPSGLFFGARWLPSVETDDGHMAIGITSAKLGYCGALVDAEIGFSLCGGFEAGVTTVVARDLEPVNPGDYPYLGLTAGPRLLWPSRSLFRLHAGLAAVFPLFRQEFQVEGGPGFQASPVAGMGFLGLGLGK